MLHTKFDGNQSIGSSEDFSRVFTIYGRGGHLGHVTSIISSNFHFLVPESLHTKFGWKWPNGVLEKQVLIFICKCPEAKIKKWPWPSILTYLHEFNKMSASSNFQVTGCNSFWKTHCFPSFLQKTYVTKFDLAVKLVKVTPWSSFEQTMMDRSPKCYMPSFVEIGPPVPGKKNDILPYMGMAAILVTWPRCREQTFVPPTKGGFT